MQNVPGAFFNVFDSPPHSREPVLSVSTPDTQHPGPVSHVWASCEPSLDIVNEYLAGGNRVKIWSSEIKYTCSVIDTQDSPCIFNCVILSMSPDMSSTNIHCVTINTSLRHPALLSESDMSEAGARAGPWERKSRRFPASGDWGESERGLSERWSETILETSRMLKHQHLMQI